MLAWLPVALLSGATWLSASRLGVLAISIPETPLCLLKFRGTIAVPLSLLGVLSIFVLETPRCRLNVLGIGAVCEFLVLGTAFDPIVLVGFGSGVCEEPSLTERS